LVAPDQLAPAGAPFGIEWRGTDEPIDFVAELFEELHRREPAIVAHLLAAMGEIGRRDPKDLIRLLAPGAEVPSDRHGKPAGEPDAPAPSMTEADAPTHWRRPCDEGETLLVEYPEAPQYDPNTGRRLNPSPSSFPRQNPYAGGTWRSR
jgi:hypothetical protein